MAEVGSEGVKVPHIKANRGPRRTQEGGGRVQLEERMREEHGHPREWVYREMMDKGEKVLAG
jgi:hypothetical protein